MKHFKFSYPRKAFQSALLNKIELVIGPSCKKVKALIYKKDKNDFYIYANPHLSDPNTVIKYIARYLGPPIIGLKRIDFYDGNSVAFQYNNHEDNSVIQKTISFFDFIRLLIQHVLE